ncbi:UvrD-helicase domain-containing protein [Streptomyces sp. NPDC051662]|uniref:UvrD-helicase domain-containing protein n=1 Tax=Streptomyces sp. NPDC051662 TaxID=3154750 RepID=UPI003412F04D
MDRHLGIVACAGSGKTEVIARRMVELLRLPSVEPRHIVAFTFTDRTAGEPKQRIVSLASEKNWEMSVDWPSFSSAPCTTMP